MLELICRIIINTGFRIIKTNSEVSADENLIKPNGNKIALFFLLREDIKFHSIHRLSFVGNTAVEKDGIIYSLRLKKDKRTEE